MKRTFSISPHELNRLYNNGNFFRGKQPNGGCPPRSFYTTDENGTEIESISGRKTVIRQSQQDHIETIKHHPSAIISGRCRVPRWDRRVDVCASYALCSPLGLLLLCVENLQPRAHYSY